MIDLKEARKKVTSLCENLDMPRYQRILLIEMVCRKVEYPEEDINELIDAAKNDAVPEQYEKLGKKSCMRLSVKRERQLLEEKLHACKNLPKKLFEGNIVEDTVYYYYNAVCEVE